MLWAIGAFALVIVSGLGAVAIIVRRLAAAEAETDIGEPET